MNKYVRYSLLVALCIFLTACRHTPDQQNTAAIPSAQSISKQEVILQEPIANEIHEFQMPTSINKKLLKEGPKPQSITANSSQEIVVNCEGGSVVKFPPNVLVYRGSDESVSGDVEISVTEYLDYQSIFFADLTTRSDKEIIETAGMVKVEVTADGKPCEIKNGEYYQVEIPSEEEKTNMELFYGEKSCDRINWISANRGRFMEGQTGNTFVNYEIKPIPKSVGFVGGNSALYDYLNKSVTFPEWTNKIEFKAVCYVNFTVNSEGEIANVKTSPYRKTYADAEISNAFKLMPKWDVPKMAKTEVRKLMYPVKLEWVKNPGKIPVKEQYASKPPETRFTASFQTDRYIMGVQRLGWVNCDRFTDNPKPRIQAFVEMDSSYDATVRLVFKDYKSVLGGTRFTKGFVFSDVPVGEKITVIAMRIVDGKYQLAMKDCVLTAYTIRDLKFEEADNETIKKKFANLGRQWNGGISYVNPVEYILKNCWSNSDT